MQNRSIRNISDYLRKDPQLQTSSVPQIKDIDKIYYKSQAGKNPDKTSKINQDVGFYNDSLSGRAFFCVCDGHGSEGHKVVSFLKDQFPRLIQQNIIGCKTIHDYKVCLNNTFRQMNQILIENNNIDCKFSGSTCVLILIVGSTLIIANIGDSRAIVCKTTNIPSMIQGVSLSNDHKPDEPGEKRRIQMRGGRVQPYLDFDGQPVGPARVWLKDNDIPGLAMSRSFGDLVAAQCGVISEPEITLYELQEQDKYIILASDGIWEFLSNQEIAEMYYPFYLRNQGELGCLKLIKESTNLWKENDEIVDDITCLIINLKR